MRDLLLGAAITIVVQAIIAAISNHFQKQESLRIVIRNELVKKIDVIGKNLYSMLASCDVYLKHCAAHTTQLKTGDKNKEAIESALRDRQLRIEVHRKALRDQFEEIRYLIWDDGQTVENALRLLVKFAQRMSVYRYRPEEGMRKLEIADALRLDIDRAFVEMLRKGATPSKSICQSIRKATLEMDDRKRGELSEEDPIVAGVDFVIPSDVVARYVAKFADPKAGDKTASRCKVYSTMINVLDSAI